MISLSYELCHKILISDFGILVQVRHKSGPICSKFTPSLVKGIGPQTIVCAFHESLHVAEEFATNFMKINQGIKKL